MEGGVVVVGACLGLLLAGWCLNRACREGLEPARYEHWTRRKRLVSGVPRAFALDGSCFDSEGLWHVDCTFARRLAVTLTPNLRLWSAFSWVHYSDFFECAGSWKGYDRSDDFHFR